MKVSDAGWRVYYLEGRLIRIIRGLKSVPGAETALDVMRAASDVVSHAIDIFDHERVSSEPQASMRVADMLRQARLSDAVRLVEGLGTDTPDSREVTDLRMCLTELDELTAFFGEEWPQGLQSGHQGLDVAQV
ncbi:MAG: hypothetical protein JSV79_07415 [Armatimonadota bacterium]|nr:MAG: hypothetical protein JSV79_07415 [Armatimonadota bacterium]